MSYARDEDRCEALFLLDRVGAIQEALRCTHDRRHVDAPTWYVEPGPVGRQVYLTEDARPHRFTFEVPLGE